MKLSKSNVVKSILANKPKNDATPRQIDCIWNTAEGKKLTPKQMDDRHLLNCIRLLERRAAEMKLSLNIQKTPAEIADSMFPIHAVMVKELEDRLNREKQPVLTMTVGKVNRRMNFDE
ncbi:MAG: hypothetical protein KGL39_02655 [Patescibacteria group bacterium]|nr:hypothetical protein [Patescibacteria group bacterium]